jgi:hypothetical protein
MEFTLGITDRRPSTWRTMDPSVWEDEQLIVGSSHTFMELMEKLCETAIKFRRDNEDENDNDDAVTNDSGINDHIWDLRITSLKKAIKPEIPRVPIIRNPDDDDDDDDDSVHPPKDSDSEDDDIEEKFRLPIVIRSPLHAEDYENEDDVLNIDDKTQEVISCQEKLSTSYLPIGSVIQVTYDYGSTTTIFLRVIKMRPIEIEKLLEYSKREPVVDGLRNEFKAVPAFKLSKDQQIDAYYPHLSKIFMGKYVPVLSQKELKDTSSGAGSENDDENNDDDDDDPHEHAANENKNVIGSIIWGKYACIKFEKDTPFCAIENKDMSNDLLICPSVMEPNEFLQVAEKAWTPRDRNDDQDKLEMYRYDSISRFLIRSDDDEGYKNLKEMILNDSGFGSKKVIFRLSKSKESLTNANANSTNHSSKPAFDFEKVFPNTYAMLTNNMFRWFQYRKGVLRVIAGRAVGHHHRDFQSEQILRTWKHKFESFHELLCAVEASWVWKGKHMGPRMFLPQIDDDLRPSNPPPQPLPCFGKDKDFVTVKSNSDLNKLVTALAITEEGEKTILYSGHDDGTLCKWCLDDNTELWSKQIYTNGINDCNRSLDTDVWVIRETMGVAGIAIRPDGQKKSNHLIFTWTHAHEGYPDIDWDNRMADKVKCWDADGTYNRSYSCDVGDTEDDDKAFPSISAVVFCELYMEDKGAWIDSMVVGMFCASQSHDWEGDYSQFDLEYVQKCGEGNILPFFENVAEHVTDGTTTRMETWRESLGLIASLAVIPRKYLLSFSIRPGHGFPDAMVLWSCKEPGVPLCRHDFWDPHQRNPLKQCTSRLQDVVGISVYGTDIILADNCGDRIAAVFVETDEGTPCLELIGYANIGSKSGDGEGFHGRMAMHGPYAIVANEISPTVWMFKTGECWNHEKLDKREGSLAKFHYEASIDGDDPIHRAGREVAIGNATFPLWGGNMPRRKKRKHGFFEFEDNSDGFGEGGPIVLAIRGKWLVGGFSNGSIARAPHLPQHFQHDDKSVSANHITSTSNLPSDEWHTPHLYFHDVDEEDGFPVQDTAEKCCIQ